MCGFVGFLKSGGFESVAGKKIVYAMSQAVAHRGPDDHGLWVDSAAGVALGHRRLAIIDLSPNGHQPMHSRCGRYTIAFNGEIYNFLDLRKDLQVLGHQFRGSSDTEVLLAAIAQWGLKKALELSNGMFALALWDATERKLSLARDRAGEKPLYYGRYGNSFIFGSELKALYTHPNFTGDIDRDAIGLYFQYGYIPAPRTPFHSTYKLPPGTMLSINADRFDVDLVPQPYWSARSALKGAIQRSWNGDFDQAQNELDALLRDAVRLRMIADVPLGAFLSGGIDSSLIVAMMQSQSAKRVRTFTVAFDDARYDESGYARAVADHLGTEHTELHVGATDALAVFPRIAELYDEPMSDSSQIPTCLISALTRNHVTVSLSGDSGDELFGGYSQYFSADRMHRRVFRWPYALRVLGSLPLLGARTLESLVPSAWQPITGWAEKARRILVSRDAPEFYAAVLSRSQGVVKGFSEAEPPFKKLLGDIPFRSFQEQMMYLDFSVYLPDDILVKVDRASMSVGLETRIPFLDPRVLEFAWSLPLEYKINGTQGKWILRQLLKRYVPDRLIERPKKGFGVPLGDWLRGPLREWAADLLDQKEIQKAGILAWKPILDTWKCHLDGRFDRAYRLWDVLVFQSWLKMYSHRFALQASSINFKPHEFAANARI